MRETRATHECRCARCAHQGPAVRAPIAAKIGAAAVWALAVVMMVGVALTGFGAVVRGPLTLAICASIYAPLAEAASEPDRCARCRAVLPAASEPAARSAAIDALAA